jgi:hypothetical protein
VCNGQDRRADLGHHAAFDAILLKLSAEKKSNKGRRVTVGVVVKVMFIVILCDIVCSGFMAAEHSKSRRKLYRIIKMPINETGKLMHFHRTERNRKLNRSFFRFLLCRRFFIF